jgi:acetyltransferase-like isoleucine patch superfamily enzyme
MSNSKKYLIAAYDILDDVYTRLILFFVGLIPGRPGNIITEPLRRHLLKMINASIKKGSQISPGFYLYRKGKFTVGENCRIGKDFQVWNFNELVIGNNLLASYGIKIICGTHASNNVREDVSGPILIGHNVWIGANVTIVGPCQIGDNVIIGANSFVRGVLEQGCTYAGSPAKKLIIRQNM